MCRLAACATLFLVCACNPGGNEEADTERPRHLLLITLDTQRADHLGCYGGGADLTPNLDQLAAAGVRFSRAFTAIPATLGSHGTLLTGRYPLAHGMTDNFHPLPEKVETLGAVLGARGFRTAMFFHLFPFHQARIARQFETAELDNSLRADGLVAALKSWLLPAARADRPLFCWIHLFIPHAPLDPPEPFLARFVRTRYEGPLTDKFDVLESIRQGRIEAPPDYIENLKERYRAEVAFTDHRVGEILAAWQQSGLRAETLVIVCADHGESYERGAFALHAPIIRDSTLQVPLLMAGPGLPAGTVVDSVVELVDVHPTILELLDVGKDSDGQGQSLVPLIEGRREGWSDVAFAMLPTTFYALDGDRVSPRSLQDMSGMTASAREGSWKLVMTGAHRELFDVAADPGELRDIAAQHPERVERMARSIEQWTQSCLMLHPGLEGSFDERTRQLLEEMGYVDPSADPPKSQPDRKNGR